MVGLGTEAAPAAAVTARSSKPISPCHDMILHVNSGGYDLFVTLICSQKWPIWQPWVINNLLAVTERLFTGGGFHSLL